MDRPRDPGERRAGNAAIGSEIQAFSFRAPSKGIVMSNRLTALWAGSMVLTLSCAVGCERQATPGTLILNPREVAVSQGAKADPVWVTSKGGLEIEGEKDGVTASYDKGRSAIVVSAARDAKVGPVELLIKDQTGQAVALKVTVQEVVLQPSTDASVEVERGGEEVTHKVQFIVQDGFFGYEKGKKAFRIGEGKDGLSAHLDKNGELITLRATNTAQLDEQELAVQGEKYMYKLKVKVKATASK